MSKIHANLIWMRVSERLSESLAQDPKLNKHFAIRLDSRTFGLRREQYTALRKLLIKRGFQPQEVGQW